MQFNRCFLLILSFLFFSLAGNAQNTLTFCLGIDPLGQPVDSGEAYAIPRNEGAAINLLIKLDSEVGTDTVQIDVYKKQFGITDSYLNSFSILVKKDYTSFITDYFFEKEGIYYFYIYGQARRQLAYGRITIEYLK